MSDVVLTPIWSGERRPAAAMELARPDACEGVAAAKRRRRVPRGMRARPRSHGERPQRGPRHHFLAASGPLAEPRGCLYPVQPGGRFADQPDCRPAQLRGLVLPAAERLQLRPAAPLTAAYWGVCRVPSGILGSP